MNAGNVLDQLAIRNLYAAYTFAVDDHDPERFADCFTPDAEIEVTSFAAMRGLIASGKAPFVNEAGRVVGADKISEMCRIVPPDVLILHLTCNLWIMQLEGDRAEAQAAFVVLAEDGLVEHYGRYQDKLARCPDGRWRFTERRDIARFERKRETTGFWSAGDAVKATAG